MHGAGRRESGGPFGQRQKQQSRTDLVALVFLPVVVPAVLFIAIFVFAHSTVLAQMVLIRLIAEVATRITRTSVRVNSQVRQRIDVANAVLAAAGAQ